MTSKEKRKFRQSRVWVQFRNMMIARTGINNDGVCELCGTVYRGRRKKQLQCHHLRPDLYKLLVPENFRVICSSCHDLIERMAVKLYWGPRSDTWRKLLEGFMPQQVTK